MSEKKNNSLIKTLKFHNLPWPLFFAFFAIIIYTAYRGVLTTDMAGIIALCVAIAAVLNEIGERLPIWNTYIGGGLIMVFFGTSLLNYFGIIPEKYVASINWFISGNVGFLTMFIIILVVGSILALEREVLLKSFAGYLPCIFGALAAAMLFGIVTGLIFGVAPSDVAIRYVLPIMGGGNGAGAVPLSQIYEEVTGDPAANYYAFAIIILTIANIMCIVLAAFLNRLGEKKPSLTGDKKTLLKNAGNLTKTENKVSYSLNDIGAALMVITGCYAFGLLFSEIILPTIMGAAIHQLAYMIIFVVILAATGIIPPQICAACKKLSSFMTSVMAIVIMVGMGIDFDILELIDVTTIQNVIIALMIVIGSVFGAAGVGYLVGFYPIDSAITAGLCMANRGGNGDLAVLGASDRMEMMAYAQLSTRLGGGIVLIIASFMFSFLL